MWILEFLPSWAPHVMLLLGIVVTLAGFGIGLIPGLKADEIILQIVGILLLVVALYLEGGIAERAQWEAKTKDLEIKLAKAEAKSAKVNTEIVTKILTQKQIIREKGETIYQYIHDNSPQADSQCTVAQSMIDAHNMAAVKETVDTKLINEAAKPPVKVPVK